MYVSLSAANTEGVSITQQWRVVIIRPPLIAARSVNLTNAQKRPLETNDLVKDDWRNASYVT